MFYSNSFRRFTDRCLASSSGNFYELDVKALSTPHVTSSFSLYPSPTRWGASHIVLSDRLHISLISSSSTSTLLFQLYFNDFNFHCLKYLWFSSQFCNVLSPPPKTNFYSSDPVPSFIPLNILNIYFGARERQRHFVLKCFACRRVSPVPSSSERASSSEHILASPTAVVSLCSALRRSSPSPVSKVQEAIKVTLW